MYDYSLSLYIIILIIIVMKNTVNDNNSNNENDDYKNTTTTSTTNNNNDYRINLIYNDGSMTFEYNCKKNCIDKGKTDTVIL